jgi:hypothetical protein
MKATGVGATSYELTWRINPLRLKRPGLLFVKNLTAKRVLVLDHTVRWRLLLVEARRRVRLNEGPAGE